MKSLIRTFNNLGFLFFLSAGLACSLTSRTPSPSTLSVLGRSDFGHVLLGGALESVVVAKNTTDSVLTLAHELSAPFYLADFQPNSCQNFIIPAHTECFFKIKFIPTEVGKYSGLFSFSGSQVAFLGEGIMPGKLTVFPEVLDFGTVTAGTQVEKTLTLRNVGSGEILFPQTQLPAEVKIRSTTCTDLLIPGEQCLVTVLIQPRLAANPYSQSLGFNSASTSLILSIRGYVLPGPSSGNISFNLSPLATSLAVNSSGNNPLVLTFTTNPLTDLYGNIIADNTPVDVAAFNLDLLEDPVAHQRVSLLTHNGVISFRVKALSTTGLGNITAQTETSFGSFSLPVVP